MRGTLVVYLIYNFAGQKYCIADVGIDCWVAIATVTLSTYKLYIHRIKCTRVYTESLIV